MGVSLPFRAPEPPKSAVPPVETPPLPESFTAPCQGKRFLPSARGVSDPGVIAFGNALVGPGRGSWALVGFKEHEGSFDRRGVLGTPLDELIEVLAFVVIERDAVFFGHGRK